MRIPLTSLLIAVAVLVSACGSDADEPTSSSSTTQASAETTEGDTSTTVGAQTTGSIGDTVVPATTTPALPADPGFTASLDDPVYTDLILDCVYGENEAGSCEQLTGAGLDAADAYGLGNSLSQAPNEAMRDDCIAGGIGCAELNARVRSAIEASDTPTL
ncbi:MAG: hypothetical protein OES57_16685, partial [Acidimicrobiia bacterium]|nr:hypothetical protein [Acidimicrobiia bacterium]